MVWKICGVLPKPLQLTVALMKVYKFRVPKDQKNIRIGLSSYQLLTTCLVIPPKCTNCWHPASNYLKLYDFTSYNAGNPWNIRGAVRSIGSFRSVRRWCSMTSPAVPDCFFVFRVWDTLSEKHVHVGTFDMFICKQNRKNDWKLKHDKTKKCHVIQ